MFEEFIGKNVHIIKTDGFVKVGKLVSADSNFIKIEYFDGNAEFIAVNSISSIKER